MGGPDGGDRVVVDTNVFVGAGFDPESASAEILRAVADRRLRMPWTDPTRDEVESVLRKIPPLSWEEFEGLFRKEDRVADAPPEGGLGWIPDPGDRKFAALARSTDAALVSNDGHLLGRRSEADFPVLTPGEYRERCPGRRE